MGDAVYDRNEYLLRRKFWSFLGQKFYIYDAREQLVGFVYQKAFKLKEDIRVYRTEAMKEELLIIKARKIIDFSAAYDVVDALNNEKVGALRRKGFTSAFFKDSWEILDNNDDVYGTLEEDSAFLSLVRRHLFALLPQTFTVKSGGLHVATFRQNWNIFIPKLMVSFHGGPEEIDRRIGLAAAVLISAIEGRQG